MSQKDTSIPMKLLVMSVPSVPDISRKTGHFVRRNNSVLAVFVGTLLLHTETFNVNFLD